MATPQFITDDMVLEELSACLHYVGGAADMLVKAPTWGTIVPNAHAKAAGEIYRRLTARGYLAAQIVQWDDGPTFELTLTIGNALIRGNAIEKAPEGFWMEFDEIKKELFDPGILILIAGVPQAPQGTIGVALAGQIDQTNIANFLPSSTDSGNDGSLIFVNAT